MEQEAAIQGILDFQSGHANGFENWRREEVARIDAIRREWTLPVGRRVRVRLRNIDEDFEGLLRLVGHPSVLDRRTPLQLRLDRMTFASDEIEQCIVVEWARLSRGASATCYRTPGNAGRTGPRGEHAWHALQAGIDPFPPIGGPGRGSLNPM